MTSAGGAFCLGVVLLSVMVPSLAADTIPVSAEQRHRLGVELQHPEPAVTLPVGQVPALVTVPPENDLVVCAPLAGLVEQVKVSRGEYVQRGQVLVRIDSPELLRHQQHLIDAWNELTVAKARHEREHQLFQAGIIARKRWLETERSWRQARTAYAQARRELIVMGLGPEAIEQLLKSSRLDSHLTLKAPLSGAVTVHQVTVGERVDRADPLIRVTAIHPLWLQMAVPVAVAERLSPGAEVRVETQHARGEVQLVAPTVDPKTQTVLVRAELTEPGGLQPGRKVSASLAVPAAGLLKLPRVALIERQGESFVFVQMPGGFEVRPVTVAGVTADAVYVEKGLHVQETVAVGGVATLKAAWLGVGEGE